MNANVQRANEECLAAYEALRRCGYLARDIYVMVAKDGRDAQGRLSAFVILKQSQAAELAINLGWFDNEEESKEFYAGWAAQCTAWNETMSHDERARIYEKSFVRANAFNFIMMLEQKFGHISQTALARVQDFKA